LAHAQFENATIRTPLLVKLSRADRATFLNEWFGPIAFVIATDSTDDSLAIARDAVKGHGALTLSLYSTHQDVIDRAVAIAEDVGVALSINLTGGVFVNQSAAFSDFHGTGANPAANAALTDAAYVANRFRVVQHRMHV
jgi:acyl-CoA reductase-like NAD-dependent aldehyde dehydrogenase